MINHCIKLKLLNGLSINAIKGDYITEEIQLHGIFDKHLYLFLQYILNRIDNATCLDVGANIGVVTLTMAPLAKKVIAFEPIPELHQMLKKTIQDNKINNCHIENVALSNTSREAYIHLQTEGNIGGSSITPPPKKIV